MREEDFMKEFKSWRGFGEFEQAIKKRTRYIHGPDVKAFLETVLQTAAKRVDMLPTESILWRAQLGCDWEPLRVDGEHIDDEATPHLPSRMRPRRQQANEGRANPKEIPYLYLATNRDTALAEVRPWIGSYISVGQFKIVRELRLVNFATDKQGSRVYFREPSREKREESVWGDIDRAFARPVSASDDVADYVPTQTIAELFKVNSYDGIAYRSSLGTGHNVALFDLDAAKLVSCFLFKVENIDFEFRECANPYSVGE